MKSTRSLQAFLRASQPRGGSPSAQPVKENLIYLVGEENLDHGVADSPRLGKHMPWGGQEDEIYETPDARSFELLCA